MIGNKLEPFKFWCQKVLPNVYDDSLSYYEYLCKLNEYLNEVITQINTLTTNMEDYEADLTATWLETKEYIDNYFNNLDVQQEINNKLDQMASDGTLSTLLAPVVAGQIGDVVANQIGATVANQIGGTVANQIGDVVANQIAEPTATATASWLTEHVDPVGSAVVVDDTLSIGGAAADSEVVGHLFAEQYDSTSTYAINDEVLYNGKLYKCVETISVAEGWNNKHWTPVTVGITFKNLGIENLNIINDNYFQANRYYEATVGVSTVNDTGTSASKNLFGFYPCNDGDTIYFYGRNNTSYNLYDSNGVLLAHPTTGGQVGIVCSVSGKTVKYWSIDDTAPKGSIKAYHIPTEYARFQSLYTTLAQANGINLQNELTTNIIKTLMVESDVVDVNSSNYSTMLPDFNSAKLNHIYNINNCLSSIGNAPTVSENSGLLLTFNGDFNRKTMSSKAFSLQILNVRQTTLLYRANWGGNWSNWRNLINDIDYAKTYQCITEAITSSNYETLLPDLDTASINKVYNIQACLQSISNVPNVSDTSATLFTYNGDVNRELNSNKSFTVQLMVTRNGELHIRSCWGGNWFSWKRVTTDMQTNGLTYNDANFSQVNKFGVIGDSLSVGAYTNKSGSGIHDLNKSWAHYIERKCDNTASYLGSTGMTTTRWIESTDPVKSLTGALNPTNKCDAYIFALGYNDANPNSSSGGVTLGSMSDIDPDDPDDNATSFYGNTDKILRKLHTAYPDSPLFVFTNPYYNTQYVPDYNTAIRDICENLTTSNNVHLIDLYELYNNIFISFASDRQNNHYHPQIYQYIGRLIVTAISDYMATHAQFFKYVSE